MTIIPRRVRRQPENCETVMSFRGPDRITPELEIIPGDVIEYRQAAGSGWVWLGRMWFWKGTP